MSVKIKGMHLPKKCMYCPLLILNQHGMNSCYASPKIYIGDFEMTYRRHEDCPMEELDDRKIPERGQRVNTIEDDIAKSQAEAVIVSKSEYI